jgi:ZIP family zinc transporter
VAAALAAVGYLHIAAVLGALATGLVGPVGGMLGAGTLAVSAAALPFAFSGGAMLWVVSHEIIPGSHRRGHERVATGGLLGGFVVMLLPDTLSP